MQLKGLVRFFTILLIIYSLYQLSFTWLVRNHEKKLEKQARTFVDKNFPTPEAKYPNNRDSQEIYREFLSQAYEARLARLKDSTKDVTLTYGFTGPISYQKAKSEELNLGLDLQGGMSITMEVEMSGVLKTLANNSKDPNFLKALSNAEARKGNSDANFVTLFVEEYKKLVPNARLAELFANANNSEIKVTDSDSKVISFLNEQAKVAFDNTARLITTRIDKFGVAQPSINPDPDKQIISVELPGVQDKERVRKNLQASANLQFWEVYTLNEIAASISSANDAFFAYNNENKPAASQQNDSTATAAAPADGTAAAPSDSGNLQDQLKQLAQQGNTSTTPEANQEEEAKKYLSGWIDFSAAAQGRINGVGLVMIKDTAEV